MNSVVFLELSVIQTKTFIIVDKYMSEFRYRQIEELRSTTFNIWQSFLWETINVESWDLAYEVLEGRNYSIMNWNIVINLIFGQEFYFNLYKLWKPQVKII